MTTNLVLLRDPQPQPAWHYTQKLPRLLELGASFLDNVGTCEEHPSRAQAQVVRTLLETGIKTSPSTQASGADAQPQPPSRSALQPTIQSAGMPPPATMSPPNHSRQVGNVTMYPNAIQQQYPHLQPQAQHLQQQQQQLHVGQTFNGPASSSIASFQGNRDPGAMPQLQSQASGFAGMPMYTPSGGEVHGPPGAFMPMPGMNDALGSVLNDFEPLFGNDTDPSLWQWGFNPNPA